MNGLRQFASGMDFRDVLVPEVAPVQTWMPEMCPDSKMHSRIRYVPYVITFEMLL